MDSKKRKNGMDDREEWLKTLLANAFQENGNPIIAITRDELIEYAIGTSTSPGPFSRATGYTPDERKELVNKLITKLTNAGLVETTFDSSSFTLYIRNVGLESVSRPVKRIDYGTSEPGDVAGNTSRTNELAEENRRGCTILGRCKTALKSLLDVILTDSDPDLSNDIGSAARGGKIKSKKTKTKTKKNKTKKNKTKKNISR